MKTNIPPAHEDLNPLSLSLTHEGYWIPPLPRIPASTSMNTNIPSPWRPASSIPLPPRKTGIPLPREDWHSRTQTSWDRMLVYPLSRRSAFSKKAWRHLPSNTDVLGLGLPIDNSFQPIISVVSLALLGNEIVVGVTLLGYGGKHVTSSIPSYENRYPLSGDLETKWLVIF